MSFEVRVLHSGHVSQPITGDLSVGFAARRETAPAVAVRVVSPIAWRDHGAAHDESSAPPRAAALTSPAAVDVAWSTVTVDREQVIATLRAERSAERGGFDHPHVASSCPFCRRAATAYRP
jgi:hypothetical protein